MSSAHVSCGGGWHWRDREEVQALTDWEQQILDELRRQTLYLRELLLRSGDGESKLDAVDKVDEQIEARIRSSNDNAH